MTGQAELKRLIAASLEDPRVEPDFLRALLEARLYVHRPRSDDAGQVRLMAFTRPDGLTVIPVFSDLEKAQFANRGGVTILPVIGRKLFESTAGATFMLDPNDVSTTLYPEEIAALLAGECRVPVPAVENLTEVLISPVVTDEYGIAERVIESIRSIEAVEAVHLVHVHRGADRAQVTGLLLILAVPAQWTERAARAMALALSTYSGPLPWGVDMFTYDPKTGPPQGLETPEFEPLWRRPLMRGSINPQEETP